MRLERVGDNQIKIFFTFDELAERGLTKEDVEQNSLKWHQLFFDMINEAYDEFEFTVDGTIFIDIFAMQAQGMVILFTLNEEDEMFMDDEPILQFSKAKKARLFCFKELEHVIQFAKRIYHVYDQGILYYYNKQYYLCLTEINEKLFLKVSAILSEYSEPSSTSVSIVHEYGKKIMDHSAIKYIHSYFLTD